MGEKFNPDKVNLAELERRAGISRAKLRRIKKSGFIDLPHALTGHKATYSSLCYDRLKENGFQGGLTIVKDYISKHKELVPPKRQLVVSQGSRGQRYHTALRRSLLFHNACTEQDNPEVHYGKSGSSYNKTAG